ICKTEFFVCENWCFVCKFQFCSCFFGFCSCFFQFCSLLFRVLQTLFLLLRPLNEVLQLLFPVLQREKVAATGETQSPRPQRGGETTWASLSRGVGRLIEKLFEQQCPIHNDTLTRLEAICNNQAARAFAANGHFLARELARLAFKHH